DLSASDSLQREACRFATRDNEPSSVFFQVLLWWDRSSVRQPRQGFDCLTSFRGRSRRGSDQQRPCLTHGDSRNPKVGFRSHEVTQRPAERRCPSFPRSFAEAKTTWKSSQRRRGLEIVPPRAGAPSASEAVCRDLVTVSKSQSRHTPLARLFGLRVEFPKPD